MVFTRFQSRLFLFLMFIFCGEKTRVWVNGPETGLNEEKKREKGDFHGQNEELAGGEEEKRAIAENEK